MMTLLLTNDLSQTFTSTIENDRYSLTVYAIPGGVCYDISRNEVVLIQGNRITPGEFMLPYYWQWAGHGNFLLLTQDNDLPDNTQFGVTQTLLYYTIAEMQAVWNGTL